MKFTLSWLKEHLSTEASLAEISEKLTAVGLEVEGISDASAALADFSVAEILEATQHPDAERLRVCRVLSNVGELQIVCGAPNARAGIKVALAKVGALIPNGNFTIKQSKIRGVESCGMLCSANELNLGTDSDGIMELPAEAAIGAPLASVLGLDDPVIEIAITPNRGDCLGVYGIARDLAAAGLGDLAPAETSLLRLRGRAGVGAEQIPPPNLPPQARGGIAVQLQTPACSQFIGVRIEGVINAPAPEWLQKKLKAIGLRPISTLVDITNYFTHTYGRPLHVYDADKLSGGIVVREALAGESFAALNDKSYTLKGGECVIADDAGVLGLGGIVGGVPSSVTEDTRNVILECAWFAPDAIAKAGRAHEILTDARYRFERTVDAGFMQQGAALAAQMILELCGGEVKGVSIAGELDANRDPIAVLPQAINAISGMPIAPDQQKDILQRLGFLISESGNDYLATPPSFRPDITMLADVAEEILRIIGYDALPAISLPKPSRSSKGALSAVQRRSTMLRRLLAGRGLLECHHFAFMSDSKAALFAQPNPDLMLQNPISADLNQMRPCLLPHLIDSASRNLARGASGATLFELGAVFSDSSEKGQQQVAATLRASEQSPKQWLGAAKAASWLDAKADALAMLTACGVDVQKVQITRDAPAYYHTGRSGAIKLGAKITLALFGELHPATLQAMDAPSPMAACEVFLDALPPAKAKAAQPLVRSDFPSTSRDFAFVVKREMAADEVLRAIRSADKLLIQSVSLFDVYQGKGLAEDEKSLAIRIELQAADRTLKDEEIEAVAQKAVSNAQSIGARLRG